MAVELIYGLSPKKARETIFSDIKKHIENGVKTVYIVPEQYAFSADSFVLETLGEKYSHLTDTINFKRMAKIVNAKYSPEITNFITEEIKDLILFNIVRDNASFLKSLKLRRKNKDNALIFKETLNELRAHLIDADKLTQISEKLSGEDFMADKLWDLSLIMREYEKYTDRLFCQYEDGFETLGKNIIKNSLYSDCEIYIDGFMHFSPAEISVVKALMQNCANIHITCLTDSPSPCDKGELFYITSKTCETLKKCALDLGINFSARHCDDGENNEITALYCGNAKKEAGFLNVTECKTLQDEVRYVAYTVKKLTTMGAEYSDISVMCGDLSLYSDCLERIFTKSGISFFMDKKAPLTKSPVCRFFVNALNVILGDFKFEDVACYVKSVPFMTDEFDSVCIFENYISSFRLKKNVFVNPAEWQKTFDIAKLGNKYLSENENKINKVYKSLVLPLAQSFKNLKKKNSAQKYTNCIADFTKKLNFQKNLKKYLDGLSDFDKRQSGTNAYNTFLEGIRSIEKICDDKKLEADEYIMLVNQMLEVYQTGVLPNSLDKVTVTDTQRGRNDDKKYVFVLGMNDGITPKNESESGFLSDIEREKIEEISNISLPTSKWKNNSSYLSLYRSMLTFRHRLYISRYLVNEEGNRTSPSFVWNNMAGMAEKNEKFDKSFVNLNEAVSVAVKKTLNPFYEKTRDEALEKKAREHKGELLNDIENTQKEGWFSFEKKADKRLLDSLYQKKLSTSVSRLEAYRKCGYSYFLQYLLDVKKRTETDYDYAKTGTILHNVLERFSSMLSRENIPWEDISVDFAGESIKKLVNKEINDNFPSLNCFNPKTQYLKNKLSRLGKTAVLYIREHYREGSFVPLGYEIPVNDEGVQPLSIALSDGSVMEIYGRIDRADVFKKDDTAYIRIIDYKQSDRSIDFALVREGISVQLFTYLKTLVENGKEYFNLEETLLPGAAMYMAYGNKLERFDNKLSEEELEKKVKNKFRMNGIVLNDESILEAMDNGFSEVPGFESSVATVSTDKKTGKINIKNLLYKEQFDMLLQECESTIKNTGENIVNGEFYIKPYRMGDKTGCDYCMYKGICYFDKTVHSYKTVSSLSKEDFFGSKNEEMEK